MLYVVGTPIGNLDDLSYRQGKVLSEVDVILSEDTRSTGQLLLRITKLFGFTINPEQRLMSYYKDNEFTKLPQVLDLLDEGKKIAIISQAGMPLISDPGTLLVKTLIKRSIPFTVIPGASAVTTALVYSGGNAQQFAFLGFFPKKTGEINKLIDKVTQLKSVLPDLTCIFFESPNRINQTLQLIASKLPESEVVVTRELTKMYEEVIHGQAKDLLEKEYRGEITLVVK